MADPRPVGVRKGAITLAVAGAVEYGLQFLVPIVLVRTLTVSEYGDYRLLWLVAAAVLAIATLNMPQNMFYFLSKGSRAERGVAVANVMALLAALGLAVGLLSLVLGGHIHYGPDSPAVHVFLGLWLFAHLLDTLPTADGNPIWQGRANVGLAVVRTLLIAAVALLSHDLTLVLYALVAGAALKALLMLVYVRRAFGFSALRLDLPMLRSQVRYALPFTAGRGLFHLHKQVDGWIVAFMFSTESLAILSIAASALPLATLLRQPLNNATLRGIATAMHDGTTDAARTLIRKANRATTLVLFPLLGLLFACADEIVTVVYTEAYQDAAAIMRVYLIGMVVAAFSTNHVLVAINRGKALFNINLLGVSLSVAAGLAGGLHFGLIGVAAGSIAGAAIKEIVGLHVTARAMETRPLKLFGWDVALKMGAATIAAAVLSKLSLAGLGLDGYPAAILLAGQSLAYLAWLAAALSLLGLWQEMEALAGVKLKRIFRSQ